MRDLNHLNPFREEYLGMLGDHGNGLFFLPVGSVELKIIASDGGGWDHVSVSLPDRCPTWDEMCVVKDLFFNESETVIQYHPAKEDYVNHHPYCLHIWKPQGIELPKPPSIFVGPKKVSA